MAAMCESSTAGARAMPIAFADYAAELVALAPDVMLGQRHPCRGRVASVARARVPIVFVTVVDPVGAGFVESLARPGGNTTGFMHVRISEWRQNGWNCSRRSRQA